MNKIFTFLLFSFFTSATFSQLSGTYSIPSAGYPTIASAISALNAQGVSANTTFNIAPGYTETLTAPLILDLSALATGVQSAYTRRITFQKGTGAGANPLINAYTGTVTMITTSPTVDGIFSITGADYVTIDGIDIFDGNTAAPATMEYGFGLFKTGPTNGTQNCTIKNCTITLNKSVIATGNPGTFNGRGAVGIFATNAVRTDLTTFITTTGVAAARNDSNTFVGNLIQNVNLGISLRGSLTNITDYDQNVTIGAVGMGNTIINYGSSSATTTYAIYCIYQNNLSVRYNTINNAAGGGSASPSITFYGIFNSTGTSSNVNISNNTVSLTGGATASSLFAINNAGGGTAAGNKVYMNNNIVENCDYTASITSGSFYGVYNSANPDSVFMNGNVIRNNTVGGTGFFDPIYCGSPVNIVVNNNQIYNNIKQNGGGTFDGIRLLSATGGFTAKNNQIYNNNLVSTTGTGTSNLYGIFSSNASTSFDVSNNQIYGSTHTGAITGAVNVYGIYLTSTVTTAPFNIQGNTIYGLSCTSGGNATIGGIYKAGGNITNIAKNNIYNISNNNTNASTFAKGIHLNSLATSSTSNNTVANNFISDVTASYSASYNGIIGIDIANIANNDINNLYFNTIVLGKTSTLTSSGTNFGVAGVRLNRSRLNMRNNLIHLNATPLGNGYVVGLRKDTTGGAGTAPNTTVLDANSGNNLYNISTCTNCYIYGEGTILPVTNGYAISGSAGTNDADFNTPCGLYKSFMAGNGGGGRESASFSESITYATGTIPANLVPTGVSAAESGGVAIAGLSTDYFGTNRAATPDIGASEFVGSSTDRSAPIITFVNTLSGNTYCPVLTASISDASGVNVGVNKPRLWFKKKTLNANAFGTYPAQNIATFNGWKYVETSNTSSPYTFTLDYALLNGGLPTNGDEIEYFVMAQDLAGVINVANNTATLSPAGYCPPSVALVGATGAVAANSFVISGQPTSISVTSNVSTVCISGIATLSANASPMLNGVTYLWEKSANGTSGWTAATGTNNGATYTTPAINTTTYYRVRVYCQGTELAASPSSSFMLEVYSPTITGTNSPQTTCGTTPVKLGAQGSTMLPLALYWFTNPISGAAIYNGDTLITSVAGATTFYVSELNGQTATTAGRTAPAPTSTGIAVSYYQIFDINKPITINSIDVYPSSTTLTNAATIELRDASNTLLFSQAISYPAIVGAPVAQTVNLGWTIYPGAGYKIGIGTGATGGFVRETSGITYPITNSTGNVSITGNTFSASNYYYCYNWQVTEACMSPRVPVVVNYVAPASPLTITPSSPTICQGETVSLNGAGSFTTYSWFPPMNLSATNTNNTIASPTITTSYLLFATDGICSDTAAVTVRVKTTPTAVATANPTSLCSAGTTTLSTAATGLPNSLTLGTGTAVSNLYSPYKGVSGGSKVQYIIRAAELTASGFFANTQVNSIGFDVTTGTPTSLIDFSISMGNVPNGTVLTTNFETGLTNVLPAAPYTPVANALNTHTFTTPFVWDGTSDVVVEACFNNNNTGTASSSMSVRYTTTTFNNSAHYLSQNSIPTLCANNGGFVGALRPNMIFGITPYSYAWTSSPAGFTASLANPSPANVSITTDYMLAVTGYNGCVLYDTVNVILSNSPIITTQPATNTAACTGNNLSLSVAASGASNSYQWYKGATPVGANLNTYTVTNLTAADAGNYTVVITNACGNVTSDIAAVTVGDVPTITTSPNASNAFCVGNLLSLDVVATGSGLNYQWYKGASPVGTNAANFTIPAVTATNAGTYNVVVSNNCGSVPSTNAIVTINNSPAISTQPATNTDVCLGGTLNLSVAASGTGNTYQWYNGASTIGANANSLSISPFTLTDAGNYTVAISNTCGNITSNTAVVSANDIPAITTQPAATTTLCENAALNLSVVATANNVAFQWKKGTNNIGLNAASFSIPALSLSDAGTYTVEISNICGSITSNNANLTVNQNTNISTQPQNTAICAGDDLNLSVAATGTNLAYQWYQGTNPIGTNSNSLTVAYNSTITGNYTVEVSGTCGNLTSNIATVSINAVTATIPSTNGTTYIADYEITDAFGWTHYYDNNATISNCNDDYLLFSIQKNGNTIGEVGVGGFQAVLGGSAAGAIDLSAAAYVNNTLGWFVMSRYWNIVPTGTGPFTDMNVRFYYQNSDLAAVNNLLTTNGQMALPHTELSFYKLNGVSNPDPASGSHNTAPAATGYGTNGLWAYHNGASASTTTWQYGVYGSDHYGEYLVNSFSGGGGGGGGGQMGPFPVELLRFEGQNNGVANVLTWQTASEQNTEKFVVMRSWDNHIFEDIGEKAAIGNIAQGAIYSLTDAYPKVGSNFYRLKIIDIDGKINLSNTIEVLVSPQLTYSLYPNPASKTLSLQLNGMNQSVRFSLYDAIGKQVFTEKWNENGAKLHDIDISTFSKGVYFYDIRHGEEVYQGKFVKE